MFVYSFVYNPICSVVKVMCICKYIADHLAMNYLSMASDLCINMALSQCIFTISVSHLQK